MKFPVYLMALFAAAIGYLLAQILGPIINLPELINAIFWFLIALATYMGSRRLKDMTWFKLISLDFILTWAFTAVGVIIGAIILDLINQKQITLNLTDLTNLFFGILPLALGPTATASMGLRDR